MALGCAGRSWRRRGLDPLAIRQRSRARSGITLETDDGALISMSSFGLRHGPPEVLPPSREGSLSIPPPTTFGPRHGSKRARSGMST